jgi:hypothetical protein
LSICESNNTQHFFPPFQYSVTQWSITLFEIGAEAAAGARACVTSPREEA